MGGAAVRRVWRVLRFEAGLWRSLFLLVARRRDGVRAGVAGFGYHRALTPVWLTLVGVSAVELAVVHLVVPWPAARLALLVLGAWGLLLMVGLWASWVVRPYLVDDAGIRLRRGLARDLRLPWPAVASVAPRTVRTWSGAGPGTAVTVEERRMGYLAGGETRVVLTLTRPLTVPAGRGRTAEVDEIHLGADDPDGLLAALLVRRRPAPRR
jgi:hypothetical protein